MVHNPGGDWHPGRGDNPRYHHSWFRNLANQLRLVVYPIIYKVLYIPSGAGILPSTVSSSFLVCLGLVAVDPLSFEGETSTSLEAFSVDNG